MAKTKIGIRLESHLTHGGTMLTLLTLLIACGDKAEDTATEESEDTAVEESEDTASEEEEGEDTSSEEESEDTAETE